MAARRPPCVARASYARCCRACREPCSMSSNPDERRVGRFRAFRRLGAVRRGKLSVVLQLTPTDCGAASLAMVLDYYGKRLPIEDVRSAVAAGKQGVTA